METRGVSTKEKVCPSIGPVSTLKIAIPKTTVNNEIIINIKIVI